VATEHRIRVKPGGTVGVDCEYTSLSAAEAVNFGAGGSNLVTLDKYVVVDCYPGTGADPTACDISGITTDATRNILIQAASGYRSGGKWNANTYTMNVSSSAIGLNNAFTRIDGIQFDMVAAVNYHYGVWSTASSLNAKAITNCIFRGSNSGSYSRFRGIYLDNYIYAGYTVVAGNIFYGFTGQYSAGIYANTNNVVYAYNNTQVNCTAGVSTGGANFLLRNNASSSAPITGSLHASSSNNVSSGVVFENAGSADYHLSASDTAARGQGVDLSADSIYPFNADIDGQAITTWSIGADSQAGVADGGATGTASITLDAATVSGSGTVADGPVTGTGAVTLDDVTVSGSGSVTSPITGMGAVTLDDATVAGVGSVTNPITGTGAVTLDGATLSATGGNVAPAAIGSGQLITINMRPFERTIDMRPFAATVRMRPYTRTIRMH